MDLELDLTREVMGKYSSVFGVWACDLRTDVGLPAGASVLVGLGKEGNKSSQKASLALHLCSSAHDSEGNEAQEMRGRGSQPYYALGSQLKKAGS